MPKLKNIKSALLLSAVVMFGGLLATAAVPGTSDKEASARQSLEVLANFCAVSTPAVPAAPQAVEAVDFDRGSHGGNSNCTPSQEILPGSGFSPKIDDPVRIKAINELLKKIAVCTPLPYSHDGIVNSNIEGGMPQAPAGYYKEYTLIVPGRQTGDGPVPVVIGGKTYMTGKMLSTRGPERIIIGGGKFIYYTMDHYRTFVQLKIVK